MITKYANTISTNTIEGIISRDEYLKLNHQGLLCKENTVLISVGEPGESYAHTVHKPPQVEGFEDVLQIEFWDLEEPIGNYKIITDDQGKQIQEFIIKNINKKFLIHCAAGVSRSSAIAKAVECIKFFGTGTENKYNYQTGFNSEIDQHTRYHPNLTVFDKVVK